METLERNKWTRNYATGYYVKMKFDEKKNAYMYHFGGGWRTVECIKRMRTWKYKANQKYEKTERGYFVAMWNAIKKACDENSWRNKKTNRKLKVNNGIKGADHLMELWEEQQKRLGGPYCAYTGVELTRIKAKTGKYQRTPTNISIDRIDGSLPYQEDNIVFCSWEFNDRKGGVTIEDCNLILKTWKEKQHEHGKTT